MPSTIYSYPLDVCTYRLYVWARDGLRTRKYGFRILAAALARFPSTPKIASGLRDVKNRH